MIWQAVVLCGKPVIEAMLAGLRLSGQIEPTVQVPLPGKCGIVTGVSQQRGDGYLRLRHVHRRQHGDPIVEPHPGRRAPGQEAGPGRRAIRMSRIATGELESLRREAVQVRCLQFTVAVACEVAVPEIVAEHDQKVRSLVTLGSDKRE